MSPTGVQCKQSRLSSKVSPPSKFLGLSQVSVQGAYFNPASREPASSFKPVSVFSGNYVDDRERSNAENSQKEENQEVEFEEEEREKGEEEGFHLCKESSDDKELVSADFVRMRRRVHSDSNKVFRPISPNAAEEFPSIRQKESSVIYFH